MPLVCRRSKRGMPATHTCSTCAIASSAGSAETSTSSGLGGAAANSDHLALVIEGATALELAHSMEDAADRAKIARWRAVNSNSCWMKTGAIRGKNQRNATARNWILHCPHIRRWPKPGIFETETVADPTSTPPREKGVGTPSPILSSRSWSGWMRSS